MATQEVVLRPGDSISLKLEVPGQPLRLDLSLTPEGVAVSGPQAGGDIAPPAGAPTVFGGVPPIAEQGPADSEPVDLSAEFAAEDMGGAEPQPAPGKVESLAAVEPFEEPAPAVDIPMEDVSEEPAQEVADSGDDLDLDLGDLGGEEEVSFDVAPEEAAMSVSDPDDFSLDDDDLSFGDDASAGLDAPTEESLGVDIPGDEEELSVDIPGGDEDLSVDIPGDDSLDLDIPDEEPVAAGSDDAGFSADAMTMVPPTGGGDAGLALEEGVELDADGNPKEKFKPGEDDTLPVWTGKARTYQDPELEKKKKETAKLNKANKPAAKPAPGKGPKLPGKAKLPSAAKKPVTKQIKKPATGGVGPAKSAPGGDGNFTVFLSPPKGADKKQAAAEIIADIQGIDLNSAMTLAGKMIVPVVKGVSEDQAQSVRDRFKDAGLSCRITQKR